MEKSNPNVRMDGHVLFRDIDKEKSIAAEIEQQQEFTQQAVDAFNRIGINPLQSEELNYFLQGGATWIEERWKAEQEVPAILGKSVIREKYIEWLERPDFSEAVAAAAKAKMIHAELFVLEGEKISINEQVRDKVVNTHTVYLTDDEQVALSKLQSAIGLLDELGFIRKSLADPVALADVDLNVSGYGLARFPDETGQRFHINPHKLKNFLAGVGHLNTRGFGPFGAAQGPAAPTRRKADFLREMSREKYS